MLREYAVLARIDAMTEEIVEFLQEMTRVPTVNPPGENYVECAYVIGKKLAEFGYEVKYLEPEGRPENTPEHPRLNVIGRLVGAGEKPLLHFNGHFDVVPAGEGWTIDPFAAEVRDGRVFGRGTADQKAGIAASVFAIEALRREGVELRGAIEQSGTVDEESGGFAGVAWLAEQGYIARGRTDFVIITEPLNVDRVCLGHRGVYWFKVATLGRIAHGSMPFLGVNAISKMGAFLAEIEHQLRPALAGRLTAMPVEPPAARHPSININSISGGQDKFSALPGGGMQTPCVADRCEAIFDRRYLIEEPIDEVRGEIREILEALAVADHEFKYHLDELMTVPPVLTDSGSKLVTTMARAVEDVMGAAPPLIASPGTYDQKHVMRLGLVDQCIAYGPGLLHLAHQPDEYCRVDHLVSAAKAMALAAMRLVC